MFWNDVKLTQWAATHVEPFSLECVNPASIDLKWSGKAKIATSDGWSDVFYSDHITLERGNLYLMDTLEYIYMPDNAVGWLALKSSMARLGLENLHAGFFDPDFNGTATLEIENRAPWPITLKKGQRIIQLALCDCMLPARPYTEVGHYCGQVGPTSDRNKDDTTR